MGKRKLIPGTRLTTLSGREWNRHVGAARIVLDGGLRTPDFPVTYQTP